MGQRLQDMTDRQLLQAYVTGRDIQAFGMFVARHESALLSFAGAFLRDDTLAQDVVQEVFLRAAASPQRLLHGGVGGAERNWLLKVVRDVSVDSLRRRATERKALQRVATTAPTSAPGADAVLEQKERIDEVRAAINRLPPRQRELVILKVREHKSYKEIAEIAGLSVTNVGFLLHQAMQALAKELQQVKG